MSSAFAFPVQVGHLSVELVSVSVMSRSCYVPWRTALPLRARSTAYYSTCSRPNVSLSPDQQPPIAYHFLNTPIPYDIGLQLQEDIVDARTEWRSRRKAVAGTEMTQDGQGDVVLLLGKSHKAVAR
jgi:hypothetical protein